MASLVGHDQTLEMIQTLVCCFEVFLIVIRLEYVTERPEHIPRKLVFFSVKSASKRICGWILKTSIAWDIFWMAWFLFERSPHSL